MKQNISTLQSALKRHPSMRYPVFTPKLLATAGPVAFLKQIRHTIIKKSLNCINALNCILDMSPIKRRAMLSKIKAVFQFLWT